MKCAPESLLPRPPSAAHLRSAISVPSVTTPASADQAGLVRMDSALLRANGHINVEPTIPAMAYQAYQAHLASAVPTLFVRIAPKVTSGNSIPVGVASVSSRIASTAARTEPAWVASAIAQTGSAAQTAAGAFFSC